MVGITRFAIKGHYTTPGGQRIDDAKRYWPNANALYRSIFDQLGMPLQDGEEVNECTKEDFIAGYDSQLGIDVILRPRSQCENTLQEKFLFTTRQTVTVEHCQDWLTLEKGDWYHLKAQYYFVGYDPFQKNHKLDPWVLLDWARVQRATSQGRIPWMLNSNDPQKVGAKASFMYAKFDSLPKEVIVAAQMNGHAMQGVLLCHP